MELRRYLLLLRQRLVLVILTVVAGLAGGYLVTSNAPIYRAQTSIYVGSRQPSGQSSTDIIQLDRIIATYAAMVKSSPVAQGAIQASHAPRTTGQVAGETTAVVIPNTNLISITVTDNDPSVAQSLANGVAASFIAQVQNLAATSGAVATSTPSVSVFQQASLPGAPLPTSLKRNLALGAIFGLIMSIGAVLLIDYLDISIRTADDLEHHSDLPVLGTIPYRRPRSTGAVAATS
jgi:capsular polysaccharide biosynthesis protein